MYIQYLIAPLCLNACLAAQDTSEDSIAISLVDLASSSYCKSQRTLSSSCSPFLTEMTEEDED